jgi:GT2 family glycosyltransferase
MNRTEPADDAGRNRVTRTKAGDKAPDERTPAVADTSADVTIVVPCYKHAHYLHECLTSIAKQTLARWRVIVVDDASPDGSEIRSVVEGFADPRIRVIRHDENRGLAAVLLGNTALDCVFPDVRRFGRLNEVTAFHGPPPGRKLVRIDDTLPGAGTMMRRRFWERVGGYDEAAALRHGREDFEFYVRAFRPVPHLALVDGDRVRAPR